MESPILFASPRRRTLRGGNSVDIRKDFRSAPVPIRLTCRYSNGIALSYYARALSVNSRSLRVLCAQPFETGVELSVLAPFLQGLTVCRVAASVRSKRQISFFELDLRTLRATLPPAEADEAADRAVQTSPNDRDELVRAAAELAGLLENAIDRRFTVAWNQLPPARRPALLAAGASAVTLLLQEKEYLDARHALLAAKERLNR